MAFVSEEETVEVNVDFFASHCPERGAEESRESGQEEGEGRVVV